MAKRKQSALVWDVELFEMPNHTLLYGKVTSNATVADACNAVYNLCRV